nr:reverse transcriptase domain-containing protein [Tanacetum cinerariifolium]
MLHGGYFEYWKAGLVVVSHFRIMLHGGYFEYCKARLVVVVYEVFEFKEVHENKRVLLIATKLCGRASAWWQQMKLTRDRVGKSKITSRKRHLFADPEDNDDDVAYGDYKSALVYDEEPEYEEGYVSRDVRVNLVKFSDVFPDADALPPLCDIQYHIDLEPGSQLPNMPHYRLCLETHEELRRQKVQDFVEGLPYHGVSSDDNLVGNSRTNFIYPWGNDEGPSIEERALLFLEAQDCAKKMA